MHLPVNLRKVSPTAMGRMSGRTPFLFLFKAINLPPARKTDTDEGAFPDANKFTTPLRDEQMGAGRGTEAASNR